MNDVVKAQGFSLVEVLIALVVLAVGVLAAAQLQASSLSASSRSEGIQNATTIARAELEHRLQMILTPNPSETCLAVIPDDYQCNVTVNRCALSGGALTCSGVAEGSSIGFEIIVNAVGPRGDAATLSSFVGSLVAVGDDTAGSGDGDGDEGGGDEGGGDEGGGDEGGGDDGGGDDGGGDDGSGDDGSGGGGPGGGGGRPVCVPPTRAC